MRPRLRRSVRSLWAIVHSDHNFRSVSAMQVIVQIARKLQTMHMAGHAHRDLKPGMQPWASRPPASTAVDVTYAALHADALVHAAKDTQAERLAA